MDVDRRKQVNYLGYIDDPIRVAHETSALKYVPDEDQFDSGDGLQRYNLRQEIRKRKQVIAGLHIEIRLMQGYLDGKPKGNLMDRK